MYKEKKEHVHVQGEYIQFKNSSRAKRPRKREKSMQGKKSESEGEREGAMMSKCLDVLFGLIVSVSLGDRDIRIKKR